VIITEITSLPFTFFRTRIGIEMPKRRNSSRLAERAVKEARSGQDVTAQDESGPEKDQATIIEEVVRQMTPAIIKSVKEAMGPEAGTDLPVDPSIIADSEGTDIDSPLVDLTSEGIESVASDIDAHVSSAIRAKIINGEFVDLVNLIHVPSGVSNDRNQQVTFVDGQLCIKPKVSQQKISDIEKWSDAFLIFMSVFCRAHPERLHELIKYMSVVRLGAKRYGGLGWKLYDEQFRLRQVRDPFNSWAIVDQELWMLYMFYAPPTQQTFGQKQTVKKCFNFNNGRCFNRACQYMHRCLKCNGVHPAAACTIGSAFRPPVERGQHAQFTFGASGNTTRPRGTLPRAYPTKY
jgi:hypothetical protein